MPLAKRRWDIETDPPVGNSSSDFFVRSYPFSPSPSPTTSSSCSLFILRWREFTSSDSPLRFQCALKHAEITSELMDSLSNLSISTRTRRLTLLESRGGGIHSRETWFYVSNDAKLTRAGRTTAFSQWRKRRLSFDANAKSDFVTKSMSIIHIYYHNKTHFAVGRKLLTAI